MSKNHCIKCGRAIDIRTGIFTKDYSWYCNRCYKALLRKGEDKNAYKGWKRRNK